MPKHSVNYILLFQSLEFLQVYVFFFRSCEMKLYIHLKKIYVRLFPDEKALCLLREMFYLTYLCTSGVFPEPKIVLETTSCMFGS